MASVYETKEFKKLQKEFYDKLHKEGFNDIERTHDGRLVDNEYTAKPYREFRLWQRGTWSRNEEWYRMASMWKYDRPNARNEWQAIAWENLSEGESFGSTHRLLRRMDHKVGYHRFRDWVAQEEKDMYEAYRPKEHTAVPGEQVVFKGTLLEPVGDYTWDVQLESGNVVELTEEDMKYVKG